MHMHDQGKCTGTGDDAALHTYSPMNEDQVCLFYPAMAQCVSGETRNLRSVLPPRATCVVATLSCPRK